MIRIPPQLADAVEEDDYPERLEWLAALSAVVRCTQEPLHDVTMREPRGASRVSPEAASEPSPP